jgi:two-component sensor histidine kinase
MSSDPPVNILLVDDQPAKLLSYEVILRELGETLITAGSAAEALELLLKTDVALILMDVCMPELDGFELVRMLREHPRFEKIAVIFVSAIQMSEMDRVRGYETGAVDYIPVPVVPEILRAKVKIFIELHRKTRQLEALNSELEERVANRTAELVQSLDRLGESEERMRLASEAAEFGTYDYDAPSDVFHCSANLRRLLAIATDRPLSLDDFLSYIHPEDRDSMRLLMHALRDGKTDRQEQEFRIQHVDGAVHWLLNRGRLFHLRGPEGGQSHRVMGTILDVTLHKHADERQQLLMAELDHRVKNVLANVSAIAHLSSLRALSVKGFVEALDGRIQAMAQAHSLLRRGNWDGADLAELAETLIRPFRTAGQGNIRIEGVPVALSAKAAQSLALVFHELATNAVKHGALSAPGGKIVIGWDRVADGGSGQIRLVWQELDGPPVSHPDTVGFGMTALRASAAEFGATLDCDFRQDGLTCTLIGAFQRPGIEFPRMPAPGFEGLANGERGGGAGAEFAPIAGKRILIVEDEPLVALQLQADLENAGLQVIGPVGSLAQGMAVATSEDFDAALVDVSLGQDISTPIADQLLLRRIPFAFATGYADVSLLPAHLRRIARLSKPYAAHQVRELLDGLFFPPTE